MSHSPTKPERVTLIAEVASNHGGSIPLIRQFIETFAAAGADIIKFQFTRVARLSSADPQYEWFQRAELSSDHLLAILETCYACKARPMWTVYNADDVPSVRAFSPLVKVGSGEAHQGRLANAIYDAKFEAVYVSEGLRPAHSLYEHRRAALLGCLTKYPTPAGVAAIKLGTGRYQGWSDHCIGINEAMLAVALGATVIEKHVCVRNQARDPQPWEATVEEFTRLRAWVDDDPAGRFLGRWGK